MKYDTNVSVMYAMTSYSKDNESRLKIKKVGCHDLVFQLLS